MGLVDHNGGGGREEEVEGAGCVMGFVYLVGFLVVAALGFVLAGVIAYPIYQLLEAGWNLAQGELP